MTVDHQQTHVDADKLWRTQGSQRCRSCKEPVVYARNVKSGKFMILNARPDWAKGNVFLHSLGAPAADGRPKATVWKTSDAETNRIAGVPFYLVHFATCPYADEHRRKS